WQVNVNQTLPGRWGNFYLTASVRDYWNSAGTTTQLQGGYTNRLRFAGTALSYSASIARQRDMETGKPGNRVQVNFALPLGRSLHSPMVALHFSEDTTSAGRTRSDQQSINGTLGENSQMSYSASASQSTDDRSYSASGQYRATYASISAS